MPLLASLFSLGCGGEQTPATSSGMLPLDSLRIKLYETIKPYKARVGIAILGLEDRDTLTLNNDFQYPTQSVYKLPLGVAVLHLVDSGLLTLTQKIHVSKADLLENTHSPLRDSFPKGNVDVTLAELLRHSVSLSDNNTTDILFRLMGGIAEVEKYMHGIGIPDIRMGAIEAELNKDWDAQFKNWTKPSEMVKLLDGLYHKKYLSDLSKDYLIRLMTDGPTGMLRLKGLLPKGTVVAHKTGTSFGTIPEFHGSTNDVGVVTLPNGKHFAIAVFVTDHKEDFETSERIIAEVSKVAFDYFIGKGK